jgi:hypothetical protein
MRRLEGDRVPMTVTRVLAILLACIGLGQEAPKPATPEPQPIIPLTASTLAANLDAYAGSRVSVTAPVREALGGTAFTIEKDPSGPAVLVVAPLLTSPVQPRAYVTVIGKVVTLEAAKVSADVASRYDGRAVILASSVINSSMIDLAKRPLLPGEEALGKTMKQVGPAFNALRTADASRATDAATSATTLTKAFSEIEAFWKANNRADAVQWTQKAQAEAAALDAAVKAGRWDEVKAAAGRLQPICQNCHNVYRERLEDGTYRLKTFK